MDEVGLCLADTLGRKKVDDKMNDHSLLLHGAHIYNSASPPTHTFTAHSLSRDERVTVHPESEGWLQEIKHNNMSGIW